MSDRGLKKGILVLLLVVVACPTTPTRIFGRLGSMTASADSLVFEFSASNDYSEPAHVPGLEVRDCESGNLFWSIEAVALVDSALSLKSGRRDPVSGNVKPVLSVTPVSSVTYGILPKGFREVVSPRVLVPGCYVVTWLDYRVIITDEGVAMRGSSAGNEGGL